MSDSPDYILDLSSHNLDTPADPAGNQVASGDDPAETGQSRKWIGVHFTCCDVYTRIWRNREGTAYVGSCPKCLRKVRARIGSDGVSARFFEAG